MTKEVRISPKLLVKIAKANRINSTTIFQFDVIDKPTRELALELCSHYGECCIENWAGPSTWHPKRIAIWLKEFIPFTLTLNVEENDIMSIPTISEISPKLQLKEVSQIEVRFPEHGISRTVHLCENKLNFSSPEEANLLLTGLCILLSMANQSIGIKKTTTNE